MEEIFREREKREALRDIGGDLGSVVRSFIGLRPLSLVEEFAVVSDTMLVPSEG